ncbi:MULTISPECIES: cytochrome-c oxidase, cbb3-type subunit III [unclassified Salinivibrio]|jgi:cytochrome c oxidase cbb3-type subunit 3|uniref:cytochrome-c oxidase, cbb3-type subunit III n=1 Tax=unclassified Salinivibrio TaxID=2636825 RepID=UPI0009861091|nr:MULTISPECIES: cytochrome-c oxidase, cbb3-type subunit III [unclassified Salinivibrio]OOE92825.1 cytochrome-c oxidase, cbb3-type subunit III [Salinivibrio sp. AR647]OOE95475.1 cytochrome-c oxidase, cbb3-type subunit III [Salinivibrio sp. AR640]
MSTFWSIFVTVIVLGTIAGCAALIIWTTKDKMGVAEGDDMGHDYDGIRELNNPLPKWWSYMFWATLVFGLGYLTLYPGLGNFAGVLGWKSSYQNVSNVDESRELMAKAQEAQHINQYAMELDAADKVFGEAFRQLAYQEDGKSLRPITQIARNEEALKVGQRLFSQNCAACHGSDARGQAGFPNLTDDAWLYGGEPETIKATLLHGRKGNMPAWLDTMGEEGVQEVAAYALSLSGRKVDPQMAAKGKTRFVVCAACHGTDGKGNPAFGAPDLTDNIWLYGGSRRAVEQTIRGGRQGVMPAWEAHLGEEKIQILSAYVWRLSNPEVE